MASYGPDSIASDSHAEPGAAPISEKGCTVRRVGMVDFSWDAIEARFPVDAGPDLDDINDFLTHPDVQHLVEVTTRKCCNRWSVPMSQYGEDFESECRTAIFLILSDPSARASAQRIRNGLATAVYVRFGDRVKQILESSEWTGSRGMSTRIRRQRALAHHAARLRDELGREPSHAEILDSYNAKMSLARANAARQGMLAEPDDLNPWSPVALDPTLDEPSAGHESDLPLSGTEARPLLESVLRSAVVQGGPLALVIQSWLGSFDADPPFIATVAEIVADTALPESIVRQQLAQGQLLCRQVLAEEFGITESDY